MSAQRTVNQNRVIAICGIGFCRRNTKPPSIIDCMLNTGIVCVLCVPEQSPVRIYSHYVFEYSLASFRSIECLYPSPVGVAKRFPPTGKKSSSIGVYSAKRNDESRSRFPFLYCSHGALSNEEYVYEKNGNASIRIEGKSSQLRIIIHLTRLGVKQTYMRATHNEIMKCTFSAFVTFDLIRFRFCKITFELRPRFGIL